MTKWQKEKLLDTLRDSLPHPPLNIQMPSTNWWLNWVFQRSTRGLPLGLAYPNLTNKVFFVCVWYFNESLNQDNSQDFINSIFLWTSASQRRWTVFGGDIGHPLRISCMLQECLHCILTSMRQYGNTIDGEMFFYCYLCMYHLYQVRTENVLPEAHHNNTGQGRNSTGFWLLQEQAV